jgi:hypothetical protein
VKFVASTVRAFSIVNEVDTFLSPTWSMEPAVGHPVGQSPAMAAHRFSGENALTKPLRDN